MGQPSSAKVAIVDVLAGGDTVAGKAVVDPPDGHGRGSSRYGGEREPAQTPGPARPGR